MKKFKTQSQRVLDLMINSIYTHKEIFLRELLSNCSDAIDKLYFKGLEGGVSGLNRSDFAIEIKADKDARTLTVSDNGIGMTAEELDNNLGVIAKSGSLQFKNENDLKDDVNIIGQFGVGFYSAFMVADKVEVVSKAYGATDANVWISGGTEGYDVKPAAREGNGTDVIMHIKPNTEDESYDEYLEEYGLRNLVKKYSDYLRYPIKMTVTKYKPAEEEGKPSEPYTEVETLNSMTPLWNKSKSEISKESYDGFYRSDFNDYEAPIRVIHYKVEGKVDYKALLFIPSHAPYDFYTKSYEKGLKIYTNSVLISDRCPELLPDYFSFVKGLVDSDLPLNVSRETVQHNYRLKAIAANIESKVKKELSEMRDSVREDYEKFFKAFGLQLKYGIYADWGAKKDLLSDLLIFHSAKQDKLVTFKEYAEAAVADQKYIYYAVAKTIDAAKALPQCEKVLNAGYDVLCCTDDIDEFALKAIEKIEDKELKNVENADIGIEDEEREEDKALTDYVKECLGDKVVKVKTSSKLGNHPVCMGSEGALTLEMEKVFAGLPEGANGGAKAEKVLELNVNHPLFAELKRMLAEDKDRLKDTASILYDGALMIAGLPVASPSAFVNLLCDLLVPSGSKAETEDVKPEVTDAKPEE